MIKDMDIQKDYDRLILIGDVHGCIDELKKLLFLCNFNKSKDRLIFAGDLVDRGPDSGAVVRFVRDNNFECVCGNHDDKHVRYFKHQKIKNKNNQYKNPINLSYDKRKAYYQLSNDDLEWMSKLPKKIYIEKYNILVIHAGVIPNTNPLNNQDDCYMYCRYINKQTYKMMPLKPDLKKPEGSILWADVYNGDVNIVYGHNVHDLTKPYVTTNEKGYKTWGIDTGCVFGGHLTCLVFEENKEPRFYQVKAKKNYFKK